MSFAAIGNALEPERRITAIALRPGAVESATIVSSSPGSGGITASVDLGKVLQEMTRLEYVHVTPPIVQREKQSQSIDRVVGTRGDMLERTPMIGHQIARSESVEQLERVIGAQVTAAKARLPPGRVAYGK